MPDPKIHIVGNQRYGCILCGKCCRRFHVAMNSQEAKRLRGLDWGNEEGIPEDFINYIGGHSYFRRQADGACVFLDSTTGECRMHRRFGYRIKALSCRGYPLNIASTYWGEVSVLARMDCPAVARDEGVLLTDDRDAIEKMVRELGPRGGFSNDELAGLTRPTVERIQECLLQLIANADNGSTAELVLTLSGIVDRLEALGQRFLNDTPTLNEVLPSLVEKVRTESHFRPAKRVGSFSRMLFRQWWAACCRCDEEVVSPTPAIRLRRMWTLAKLLVGHGCLRSLGMEHPAVPIAQADPFLTASPEPSPSELWTCYRRFLRTRIDALQFFGASYYHADIFQGLKALVLTYPLVLASARHHALARKNNRLEEGDVLYGLSVIDHTHGRSPLLQAPMWRTVEGYFTGNRLPRLIHSLGWE